jgi:hypothetical protein
LVKIVNINRLKVPVDVDDDSDGNSRLRSCNSNDDQTEKMAMHLIRIKKPVENHKINVHRIEYQFNGHEHGNQISSCQETVDANKEHQGTDNKKGVKGNVIYHDSNELSELDFSSKI